MRRFALILSLLCLAACHSVKVITRAPARPSDTSGKKIHVRNSVRVSGQLQVEQTRTITVDKK